MAIARIEGQRSFRRAGTRRGAFVFLKRTGVGGKGPLARLWIGTTARARALKGRPVIERCGFAISGIVGTWRRERSFRTQVLVSAVVAACLLVLQPGFLWDALAALAIALVLAFELVNAAIEAVLDYLHPEIADPIKIAKDTASGAVLMVTLGAAVVAAFLVAARFL